jgi:hypothetical protein
MILLVSNDALADERFAMATSAESLPEIPRTPPT